jgi:SAM-dependent methyltransferase
MGNAADYASRPPMGGIKKEPFPNSQSAREPARAGSGEGRKGSIGHPTAVVSYQAVRSHKISHDTFSGGEMNVLVAGCGPKPVPPGSVGVDINYNYARRAKIASWGAAIVVGDIRQLPFKDTVFSEVVCWEVIEHIPEKGKAMCELARVSKEGATLVLSTPLAHIERFLAKISRTYNETVFKTQHRFCVSPEETIHIVKQFYRVKKVSYSPDMFAYCLAVCFLLDIFGVWFNDAGELCGKNAKIVHKLSVIFALFFCWVFRLINRMLPYWATKSIILEAVRYER